MRVLMMLCAAVLAGAFLAPAPASADYKPGYKKSKSVAAKTKRRAPQVAGFRLRGGYRDDLEYQPYVRFNDGYTSYNPYFNNMRFSERVFEGTR